MTRELIDLLNRMRETLLRSNKGYNLTKEELRLIIKYINDLEIEISGGDETND